MTNTPVSLQDLKRKIFVKAKTEPSWRFWGLYVHVRKMETLREAYVLAKKSNGAPGVGGVTFEAIEKQRVESFLKQIRDFLHSWRKRKRPPATGSTPTSSMLAPLTIWSC